MAIRIKSINSDLTQQIFRVISTRQPIAATIRFVLLRLEKGPFPTFSRKEAQYELEDT